MVSACLSETLPWSLRATPFWIVPESRLPCKGDDATYQIQASLRTVTLCSYTRLVPWLGTIGNPSHSGIGSQSLSGGEPNGLSSRGEVLGASWVPDLVCVTTCHCCSSSQGGSKSQMAGLRLGSMVGAMDRAAGHSLVLSCPGDCWFGTQSWPWPWPQLQLKSNIA